MVNSVHPVQVQLPNIESAKFKNDPNHGINISFSFQKWLRQVTKGIMVQNQKFPKKKSVDRFWEI